VTSDTDFIILGCFGRVHGIKGFITLHSYTTPRDNLLHYKPCFYLLDKQWQPLQLKQVEVSDKQLLARVEGYDDRESVARLTHVQIGIRRDQLPDLNDGEFYWHELVGMTVINQQGTVFGKVTELIATGSNDVLIVEEEVSDASQDKRQVLIPYLPGSSIVAVSKADRSISVDWDWDY
jgi:16S rRNA processing protein RimM